MATPITGDIEKGKALKHVATEDKSKPTIDPNTVVKKVDREGFLTEVEKGADLKKAETKDHSSPKLDGASVTQVDRVLQMQALKLAAVARELAGGNFDLSKAETADKSAPAIPEDAKLKTVDHKALFTEVEKGAELKKTETKDHSSPKLEGVSVSQIDRVLQMQALKLAAVARELAGGNFDLSKAETTDKSAPAIPEDAKLKTLDKKALLAEVEKGAELKKTETKDQSSPNLEGASVGQIDRILMMQAVKLAAVAREVTAGGFSLAHADTVDKSLPLVDQDAKLKTADKKALLAEVEKGADLKKAETKDQSSPKLEGVSVNQIDRVLQMQALKLAAVARELAGGDFDLSKAETKDMSAPVIDPHVHVKHVDRKELVAGVAKPPELKKAETKDASHPVIEKDVKIKTGERKELLDEVVQKKKQTGSVPWLMLQD